MDVKFGHNSSLSFTTDVFGPSVYDQVKDTLLDEMTYFVVARLMFFILLSFLVGTFGTATNIINIIVFIRQGIFSGGSTVTLFFLSVADLGVVFTMSLHGIGFAVMEANIPNLSWDPWPFIYLLIGWPHSIFIIINRLLTSYVAFERCMCVVMPFRVQSLFTPRNSLIYIITCFVYTFLSHIPIYLTNRFGYVKREGTNSSILTLVRTADRDFWYDVVDYANYFTLTILSVAVVLVCTVVTSIHVNMSKHWRNAMSSNSAPVSKISGTNTKPVNASNTGKADDKDKPAKNDQISIKSKVDKEAKLVKMITAISIIFLVCYVPEITYIVVRSIDERIRIKGQYYRLSYLMHSFIFVSGTVNSSINIFIYYTMSSKYRKEFLLYFGRNKKLNM